MTAPRPWRTRTHAGPHGPHVTVLDATGAVVCVMRGPGDRAANADAIVRAVNAAEALRLARDGTDLARVAGLIGLRWGEPDGTVLAPYGVTTSPPPRPAPRNTNNVKGG